ncbi:MAG TPA: ribosome-binding factor A [Parcubacteria group bacterium]|nr:ribosome-binding factor A [Parcubacteria group bacterium]
MRQIKHDKVEETIHREAAKFILENSGNSSLITVTRVTLNPSGKDAIIYFTTLPESEEDTAKKFLDRKAPEFKDHMMHESRIGIIPHLRFQIDYGERNRQRLDEIGKDIQA